MRTRGLLFALLLTAAPAHADELVIQSGQDSSPYSFVPGLARGTHASAYAFSTFSGGAQHTFEYYLRFDLPPALFEPGVEIAHAEARVYHGFVSSLSAGEQGELVCHPVLAPWIEVGPGALTWSNRPAIGPAFDAHEEIHQLGPYACDVTELLESWIADPASNHGIALTSQLDRALGIHTFQDTSVAPEFRPTLTVQTVPEPAAAALLAAGGALLATLDRRRARRRRSQPRNPHPSERRIS